MKIAVTGASGQVGVTLVKELLKQQHVVRVLIHESRKGLENLPVEFFEGNVLNPEDCDRLCQGMDAVFHLAAIVSINGEQKGHVWNVNYNGTKNMLDACVKNSIKKLVHFSSIHAFCGQPVDKPLDETRALQNGNCFAYERSKAAAQKLVCEYTREKSLNASIINPTAILGFEDHQPSIKGKMLIDFYNEKIPMLFPGGYDWVDTRDVVKAAIAALHHGGAGDCYLVPGKYYTLTELSKAIGEVTGKKTPTLILPMWLIKALLPFIQLYSKITRTEPLYTDESLKALLEGNKNVVYKKAAQQLGHAPRPLKETIADSYEWFRKEGLIK